MTESASNTHAVRARASIFVRSFLMADATPAPVMGANPLIGLPTHVCERVLERMDAGDFNALACVSKACAALVRKSAAFTYRRRLLNRFMCEMGAKRTTALSKVMRCLLEEYGPDALADSRLVCHAFYASAHRHLRCVFSGIEAACALDAFSGLRAGQRLAYVASRPPRMSFLPESSDEDEDEDEDEE